MHGELGDSIIHIMCFRLLIVIKCCITYDCTNLITLESGGNKTGLLRGKNELSTISVGI